MSDYKKFQKQIAAGILPFCAKTKRILFCQRGSHQSFPLMWASWGGKFDEEKDKTPQDCAKREFLEETRCKKDYIITKEPLYIVDENSIKYYLFAAIFNEEWEPNIKAQKEAAGWGWFSLDNLPKNMMPSLSSFFNKEKELIEKIFNNYE